ncbi:MAG: BON domain-containing protein [Burkholderiales bacterium]
MALFAQSAAHGFNDIMRSRTHFMICANCKSEITDTSKFCKKCGASVIAASVAAPETKTCPSCGTVNAANAKFCKKDGYNFGAFAQDVVAPAAPPPSAIPPVVKPVDVPKIQEATSKPTPPVEDSVICPKCGTPNFSGAKFCKKDGYALQAGVAAPQAIPIPRATPIKQSAPTTARSAGIGGNASAAKISTAATAGKSRKGLVIGALVGVVLLACVAGGYAYWAGYIGNRQGGLQEKINVELANRGMSNIKVTVDHEWVATLSGSLLSQAEKDQALGVAKAHPELKKIVDTIQIQPDAGELEKNLNKALSDAGLGALAAHVDKDLTATLTGVAESPDQKTQALTVAKGVAGLKDVKDEIQVAAIPEPTLQAAPAEIAPPIPSPPQPTANVPRPAVKLGPPQAPTPRPQASIDPAKLEGELNRALRNGGAGGVTAQVNDDLSVTLKGAGSASEKERAMQVVRQFRGIRAVKDKIFVVE